MNNPTITADTITDEALASISIEELIRRAEEDDTKAEAAEEEAVQAHQRAKEAEDRGKKEVAQEDAKKQAAQMRALLSWRDSGEWWFIIEQKAKADNLPFGPIVEAHCKVTGKGKTAIYDNMRVRNNWGRFDWPDLEGFRRADGSAGNPPTLAGLPTSRTMFIFMLQEMDGKRERDKKKRAERKKKEEERKRKEEENRKKAEEETKRKRELEDKAKGQGQPGSGETATKPHLYDAPPDEPKEPEDQETTKAQANAFWEAWENASEKALDMVFAARLDEVETIVKRVKPQVEADRERLSRNVS